MSDPLLRVCYLCGHPTPGPHSASCRDVDSGVVEVAKPVSPAEVASLTAERDWLREELNRSRGARLLSVVLGHHGSAPKPFALQRRDGHALVALGAEFPDGAVALRLTDDGGWTTKSDGGADALAAGSDTEIVWLSDELEPLAEMEAERDTALASLAAAEERAERMRAVVDKARTLLLYWRGIAKSWLEPAEVEFCAAVDALDAEEPKP